MDGSLCSQWCFELNYMGSLANDSKYCANVAMREQEALLLC